MSIFSRCFNFTRIIPAAKGYSMAYKAASQSSCTSPPVTTIRIFYSILPGEMFLGWMYAYTFCKTIEVLSLQDRVNTLATNWFQRYYDSKNDEMELMFQNGLDQNYV